ncbi:MAG: hypothetical protein QF362_01305 [Candidatus Woesearchaeota archaeon]|jgi:hypothetical protein|nr:hypothetical protein [Candidatus Woesearchaeota archaeon]MDP7506062.1 hypothetical protein [Candidatus Woesearchaeota archaeon]MDP7610533.1 hypothetical protein [Candidatus Woesearchaeota archaeon]|tara:strand:+ start:5673 stop:6530 length:858 start_codon:yes stop_codon:yes gene_type:complete
MNKKITNLVFVNIILSIGILGYLMFGQQGTTSTQGDFMNSLKTNLQAHEEFQGSGWEYPRVTMLTSGILTTAKQNNLEFYNTAKDGDYLLEFTGASVIYNYNDDEIINIRAFETVPQDLLLKLIAHEGLENYANQQPNIIEITSQNLENLKQQINGIDETQIGNYIVSYQDLVLLYDYMQDTVLDSIRFEAVPQDLLLKLTAHDEMQAYKEVDPFNMVIVKQDNLQALQQQIGGLDETHIGAFIISYPDNRVVMYDYVNDAILVNNVLQPVPSEVQEEAPTQPNE